MIVSLDKLLDLAVWMDKAFKFIYEFLFPLQLKPKGFLEKSF